MTDTLLDIEAIGLKGDGIARQNSERLHIPFTLPGERISATVQPGGST